jgi:hypothetical protein
MGWVYHPTAPTGVAQIGDVIGGRTITGLYVFDQLAAATTDAAGNARAERRGDHRVAFWANTDAGNMVVRASHLDSDEDGLLDHWETSGIDMDGAIDLDLNTMGASPLKRDVFLEIDWLNDRNDGINPVHRNEPAPGVTKALVDMFAAAPALANGIPAGIKLHIDAGPGNDANGNPFSQNVGAGSLQGGDRIGQPGMPNTHIDVVYFGTPGALTVPGVEARDFQGIKDAQLRRGGGLHGSGDGAR